MAVMFRKAELDDMELVISIQNEAFYEDYLRFGFCSSYDRKIQQMEFLLKENQSYGYSDYLIYEEDQPVGNMIIKIREGKECHLSSLCVITSRRSSGIGSIALEFLEKEFNGCNKITLETPAEKTENVAFYQKNGFQIVEKVFSKEIYCFLFEKRIS